MSQIKEESLEPNPIPNNNRPIWDIAIEKYKLMAHPSGLKNKIVGMMKERDIVGRNRYGTPLQAFNGRNCLNDAIEEVEDAIAYTVQAIEEGSDLDSNLTDILKTLFITLENMVLVANMNSDVDLLFG